MVYTYVGAGLTGFGLVPGRPKDSVGGGVAVSWLNRSLGFRSNEVMLAAYYQMHAVGDIYLAAHADIHPEPRTEPELLAGHRDHHAGHHPVLTGIGADILSMLSRLAPHGTLSLSARVVLIRPI